MSASGRRRRLGWAANLSGDEVCRALKRLGFVFQRQTGSHRHYAKGGRHPRVPVHREIRPKTLQSILKQADLTLVELLANL
ncbi:MAG: type II toxin-antitoxin system HicA family toxin [Verrucomicrobia bacterium]|nr:type II toxin-antitoxin system HicA family toxin [Verrucomicrobiota bacterium]